MWFLFVNQNPDFIQMLHKTVDIKAENFEMHFGEKLLAFGSESISPLLVNLSGLLKALSPDMISEIACKSSRTCSVDV